MILPENLLIGVVSPQQMLANFIVAAMITLAIAVVYQRTHNGSSYSRNFVVSIVMVGIVMGAVMMVIGNSLARAFGLFGAFSLVRFRSAIKDPKDIGYIFWS